MNAEQKRRETPEYKKYQKRAKASDHREWLKRRNLGDKEIARRMKEYHAKA